MTEAATNANANSKTVAANPLDDRELSRALAEVATAPILLVASDYDGTIAPIVNDPTQARPRREAVVALNNLATMSQTHVAVISSRALNDLCDLLGPVDDVHLVGSHGSEFDSDFAGSLGPEAQRLRNRLVDELSTIAARGAGFTIETKPASVAFHYRNANDDEVDAALGALLDGPASLEGVFTKRGKKVVELSVLSQNKGTALETIRHRAGASAVIFFGDDETDEDAFATLRGPDVAIKVGQGDSRARFRVENPDDIARLLARLSELRAEWLTGAEATPIERHSMLSDQRTAALVTPDARVTWFCAPRLDSPSIFAELLGGPTAGYFSIRPVDGAAPTRQRYLDRSLVLETRWPSMTVTDFLDCSAGRPNQRAGRTDLIRLIEGAGRVRLEFAPRLDFGRIATNLTKRDGGVVVEDTHDPIVLHSPGVEWEITQEGKHQTAVAEVDLDEPIALDLRYGTGSLRQFSTPALDRLRLTDRYWSSWTEQLALPEVEPEFVQRCALVLKGLCYGPAGSIAAAATTSLPEHIGGVRNWDYRFCWLRDAAMTAGALVKLGSISEAMEYLDWVLGVVDHCESPERLQPLYGLKGEALGSEAEISELSGYRGSRPVRVGNSASRQVQLDVFGPIVELVALLADRDAPLSSNHWRLVEEMVRAVERRWREPDHGIWEIRRPRRHHVHSKVMCWTTVDRAIRISDRFLDRDRPDWVRLRDEIADDVLEHGYKEKVHAFTAAYDDVDLDAAALYIGLTGLVEPDDPRFLGTLEAIERELLEGPTVYRYRSDDGLPGVEGGFHICASWLVESYLLVGRVDDARSLFNEMIALAGPTGMLPEQYGAKSKRALGNTPQAYSHLGVIENAIRLAAALK
ncbi:MAG: trehalose-phosphatase [Phycisphaerales bacterium]